MLSGTHILDFQAYSALVSTQRTNNHRKYSKEKDGRAQSAKIRASVLRATQRRVTSECS